MTHMEEDFALKVIQEQVGGLLNESTDRSRPEALSGNGNYNAKNST